MMVKDLYLFGEVVSGKSRELYCRAKRGKNHGTGQFDKEASQTRDYCVAKCATQRAACPDPSRRKEHLLRMTIKLTHH
jgi:hypothetical protein